MTSDLVYYGLTLLLFILLSAFFSASETALTAITRARLYHLVKEGNRRAEIASKLRQNKESLIGTVLLGNTAVNIAASALATSLAIRVIGNSDTGLLIVTVVMTLLLVIFSEILPKTYAIQNAEHVALAFAPALKLVVTLLYPITRSIQTFTRFLFRMLGIDITKSNALISVNNLLRGTIELHHSEGSMIKHDRDILVGILDLSDIEVKDIMLHRKQIETLDANLPPAELVRQAIGTLHSRIPLWRDQPDNIIGLLHVKDLIRLMGENREVQTADILDVSHKPWFIPEATTLRNQLLAFRSKRQHFAFVVDEYGGWQGIVTLEDIFEEIVGEIDDEHDEADNDIESAGEDTYIVAGSVSLRDINRHLGWDLPDELASTVAGLLIYEAETIPAVGEVFTLYGFRFTVLEKDALQLTRLRIEKLPEAKTSESAAS
jgi:Mg2+/Co2+ transporter CorB